MRGRIRCRYCGRLFHADPRCKNPRACLDPKCQRERRNKSHKRWCDRDPEVVKDRRATTREWFARHPGYLGRYRASHPDYVARNREAQRERRRRPRVDKSISKSGYPVDKQGQYFKLVPVGGCVDKSIPIFVQRLDLCSELSRLLPALINQP